MRRSIRLGRAFGIPLYVHWSFWLAPLLWVILSFQEGPAGILFGQLLILSIFGCVLLHELGHALMARFFGIRTHDITLYPIGGVARLESTGARPLEEVCIALAGPAVNLFLVLLLSPLVVLAFLAGLLTGPVALGGGAGLLRFLASFVVALWAGNGVLLVFNLLPVFPMDGGRVLRALLSLGLGQLRATEVAASLALFLAGGLALAGLLMHNPSLVVVPFVIAFAGQAELYALRQRHRPRRLAPIVIDSGSEPATLPETSVPPLHGFTGFVWDRENGVWVRWVNGQPLDVC
jgi:Zn-dependent protease